MSDDELSISYSQEFVMTVKQEATFVMRQSDWLRIRTRVERLKRQRREFAAAAWAAVGVAVSAGLSMLSWAPAFGVLTDAQRAEFAWIWPALIALMAFGVFIALGGFVGAHIVKQAAIETVETVAGDMDDIHDVRHLITG